MKKKTKVIASSALSIAVCASLIAGSTLAIFSSESNVDVAITSGKVDVKASVEENSLKGYSVEWDEGVKNYIDKQVYDSAFKNGGTFSYENGSLKLDKISPGDSVEFDLDIKNSSSIKINYRVQLTIPEITDSGDKQDTVAEALEVTFDGEDPVKIDNKTLIAQPWVGPIEAGTKIDKPVSVRIALPWQADNTYAGQSCELKIGVYAVQSNAHITDPNPEAAATIFNAVDLYRFAEEAEANSFEGQTVELGSNIYLGESALSASTFSAYVLADTGSESITEKPWAPIGNTEHPFMGIFEGNGYTIYGLTAEGSAQVGLFGVTENATIQDVKISGAEITANDDAAVAGVLVGEAKGNLSIKNVTVEDSAVTKDEDAEGATLGALVGKVTKDEVEGAEEPNVTVEGVDVQMNEASSDLGSGLVGSGEVDYSKDSDSDLEFNPVVGFAEKVEIRNGSEQRRYYEISSADGLTYFAKTVNGNDEDPKLEAKDYEGLTVSLKADIDLKVVENWTPIGKENAPFKGTFDGAKKTAEDGTVTEVYTISGLTSSGAYAGLFGVTEGATITNLNIVGATVTASGENAKTGALVAEAKGDYSHPLTVNNITVTDTTVKTGEGASDAKVGALVGNAQSSIAANEIDVVLNKESDAAFAEVDFKTFQLVGNADNKQAGSSSQLDAGLKKIKVPEGEIKIVLGTELEEGFVQKQKLSKGSNSSYFAYVKAYYEIYSADGLGAFRNEVNKGTFFQSSGTSATNFYLMNDIDLENKDWEPIGNLFDEFNDNFHGNDHTIRNLVVEGDGNGTYGGLFGKVSGNIEDLHLVNVELSGYKYLGGIAGYHEYYYGSGVKNCTVKNVDMTAIILEGLTPDFLPDAIVGNKQDMSTSSAENVSDLTVKYGDGTLKNVKNETLTSYFGKVYNYITSFDVETRADFEAAAKMIDAGMFGLDAYEKNKSYTSGSSTQTSKKVLVTMNLKGGEYDFSNSDYKPVSLDGFTVNGNNAVIKNLNVNADENGLAGLFGKISNTTVSDLVFDTATLSGEAVGVIAGIAEYSTFNGITVKGNINLMWKGSREDEYGYSSKIGVGILTGYYDTGYGSDLPQATLECNLTIDYGSLKKQIPEKTNGPSCLTWSNKEKHYLGCASAMSANKMGNVVEGTGFTLTEKNAPKAE